MRFIICLLVNLAFALALRKHPKTDNPLRVGVLDLDIFGPSIPTLMGLKTAGEPDLTSSAYQIRVFVSRSTQLICSFYLDGSILPLINHGLPCMSMGFLIPSHEPSSSDNTDTPIVWRGLMVQKAVQQLLFDVDWSKDGQGLDILVVDMPPGTGDVPLTLGQLVHVNGEVFLVKISMVCSMCSQGRLSSRHRKMWLFLMFERELLC